MKPPHEDLYWQDAPPTVNSSIEIHIDLRLRPVHDGTRFIQWVPEGRPFLDGILDGVAFEHTEFPGNIRSLCVRERHAFIDVPSLHDAPDSAWRDFAAKLGIYLGKVDFLRPDDWIMVDMKGKQRDYTERGA